MGKILLAGYMGCGKTSVSTELKHLTRLPHYDLDHEISKFYSLSIPEIFEKFGEIAFRKKEKEILESMMRSPEDFILSLGGGTPCYSDNAKYLDYPHSHSFYLYASVENLVLRNKNSSERPLLANIGESQREEFIAKHLFERSPYYSRANFRIDTNGKTPKEIAVEIANQLRKA